MRADSCEDNHLYVYKEKQGYDPGNLDPESGTFQPHYILWGDLWSLALLHKPVIVILLKKNQQQKRQVL